MWQYANWLRYVEDIKQIGAFRISILAFYWIIVISFLNWHIGILAYYLIIYSMKKEDLRIVYMGTPEFAVEGLRCLVEGGYNIVGVITMPDKPAGRGHKIQYSPVKQYALDHDLPLLQPGKTKG